MIYCLEMINNCVIYMLNMIYEKLFKQNRQTNKLLMK